MFLEIWKLREKFWPGMRKKDGKVEGDKKKGEDVICPLIFRSGVDFDGSWTTQ